MLKKILLLIITGNLIATEDLQQPPFSQEYITTITTLKKVEQNHFAHTIDQACTALTSQHFLKASLGLEDETIYTWRDALQDWVLPTASTMIAIALTHYCGTKNVTSFMQEYGIWIACATNIAAHAIVPTAYPVNIAHKLLKGLMTSCILASGYGFMYAYKNKQLKIINTTLNQENIRHQEQIRSLNNRVETLQKTTDQEHVLLAKRVTEQAAVIQHLKDNIEKQTVEKARLKVVVEELERLFNKQDHP